MIPERWSWYQPCMNGVDVNSFFWHLHEFVNCLNLVSSKKCWGFRVEGFRHVSLEFMKSVRRKPLAASELKMTKAMAHGLCSSACSLKVFREPLVQWNFQNLHVVSCDGKDRKNNFTEEKGLHRRVRARKELRLYDGFHFIMPATAEMFWRGFKERTSLQSVVCHVINLGYLVFFSFSPCQKALFMKCHGKQSMQRNFQAAFFGFWEVQLPEAVWLAGVPEETPPNAARGSAGSCAVKNRDQTGRPVLSLLLSLFS